MRGSTPVRTDDRLALEERREATRHDALYRQRPASGLALAADDWERFDRLSVPSTAYQASVHRLGPVAGLRILDAGCGDGWLSVILAKRGARVDGLDVSREAVAMACSRAEANGVTRVTNFAVGSLYAMPFGDAAYDAVIGQAVLHHCGDKARAARELQRVLRPGGRAVFAEPLGNSLWLERLRRFVPVPSEAPDDPDQWRTQFKHRDLAALRPWFEIEVEEFHLLSRLDRLITAPRFLDWMRRIDQRLLRHLPPLRWFARSIVIECRRPPS